MYVLRNEKHKRSGCADSVSVLYFIEKTNGSLQRNVALNSDEFTWTLITTLQVYKCMKTCLKRVYIGKMNLY